MSSLCEGTLERTETRAEHRVELLEINLGDASYTRYSYTRYSSRQNPLEILQSIKPRNIEIIKGELMITLDLPASKALYSWEKLVESGVRVFVDWTGENDISPAEIGRRIGKILAKMGVELSIHTKEPVDAVELVREARE